MPAWRRNGTIVVAAAALAIGLSAAGAEARPVVGFPSDYAAGTIVITPERAQTLFGARFAQRHRLSGRGRQARQGMERLRPGRRQVCRARLGAAAVVKRDHPELPDLIPGGSPHNPMGARAITLDRDEVAIHGTTAAMRPSVGTAASYGCIRMYNEDVIDLYDRVSVGAPVVMIR